MNVKELGAVQLRANIFQRSTEVDVCGLPVSSDDAVRKEADVAKGLPQPERAKDFDAVRRHLNTGADFAEGRGAFEDPRLDPELPERG